MDDLDEDERDLANEVFDLILQVRQYKDQNDLIKWVVRLSNGTLSERRVRSVMEQLAQSAALRSLRH